MENINIIVDGHCDTLSVALDKKLSLMNEELRFNYSEAKKVGSVIQFFAVFISPKFIDTSKGAYKRANDIIDKFYLEKNDMIHILKNSDINDVINDKKVGGILSIENGSAICGNLSYVDELYNRGIRMMSVTWNEDNDLGSGINSSNDIGLTELGKRYIKKLENKKILVDVSHASEKTFWDIVENSEKPIVASHSCVYSLCENKRNLKDDQIKEIAKKMGIIGISFVSSFLKNTGIANVQDIIKHILYIINLVGIDFVGLGSDFDGISPDRSLSDVKSIGNLEFIVEGLKKEGLSR